MERFTQNGDPANDQDDIDKLVHTYVRSDDQCSKYTLLNINVAYFLAYGKQTYKLWI